MATKANLVPLGSNVGPQGARATSGVPLFATQLVPTGPAGGIGLPASQVVIASKSFSDAAIRGALVVNPAYSAEFYSGNFLDQSPKNNQRNQPLETTDRAVAQEQAARQSPNYWDKRTLPPMSNDVLFGPGVAPQKPITVPWVKQFIPPLSLFNDASQWVNRLFFNQPMTWFGAATSLPPIKAQYFTPPPINTSNWGAGELNLQLQLGQMKIQAARLTMDQSNYFGGS